jgi:hypothetical protein
MAKLVLLRLADRADEESGICYPSQRRIAAECCITERTVRNAITDLIACGLVIIHTPSTPKGDSTRYRLTFATPPEPHSGGEPHSGEEQDSSGRGTTFQREGNHVPVTPEPRSAKPSVNPQRTIREPSVDKNRSTPECSPDASLAGSDTNTPPVRKNAVAVARTLKTNTFNTEFQSFCKEYPKPIRPESADKICDLWLSMVIQTKTADDILADIRFRKTTDDWMKKGGRYVPTADSYLERQLWLETTTLIARLTHELDRHPGNPDSIYHDPSASQAIVENFKAEKARLRELQRGQS